MFWLLMEVRVRGLWNVAVQKARTAPVLVSGLGALGALLFAAMYVAFGALFIVSPGESARVGLVYEIFYFLFLFMLAGAVPFVASTLLHSADFLLLGASPIRTPAVVAAKLLDAGVTNSMQFVIIGLPAIAACADACSLGVLECAALGLLGIAFILLPALLTAVALLGAMALFGAGAVRRAIMAVNALMGASVCLTMVMEAGRLPIHGAPVDLGSVLHGVSPLARYGPSSLAAEGLLQLGRHDWAGFAGSFGALAGVVGALFVLCAVCGGDLVLRAALEQQEAPTSANRPVGTADVSFLLRLLSPPVAAVIGKDLRYLLRDSVLLSQFGMPAILFLVPVVLLIRGVGPFTATPAELYPFAVGMLVVILFMQTSILSLSALGLENRGFWLMMASPNAPRSLLGAKFLMSATVTAGVGVLMTLAAALVFQAEAGVVALQCGLVLVSAFALCGLGVGLSASFPRFIYENPAHRVSVWAMILGFLGSVTYMLVAGLLITAAFSLPVLVPEETATIHRVCAAGYLALSILTAAIPLGVGTRRLQQYQWEG